MSFEENLKKANEALTRLNEEELSLEESVKIYKLGLENIEKARFELEKAKLEVEKIDE
ncbi:MULTISPECIES: exodeoxyribonuclease VII small subunit [Campylobacter]|uniref:Exodeoxyribonuclease VII small subunit n=1 Tax=Campylobacter helveticus TaxID=28898 RepID=A0AAX2UHD8_9BACT|nr:MULTISPECIES: exodeoxyribonuclease VII small subunit [Campylobacter]EAK0492387.1 exodeoxyribonuclease VII small subunit [Campylobacter upsaliensis]ARE80076.1 exodeoxyribonuclease VII, small subunit [Campylobacter helveticus]MCR2055216.1 exodeoxyribonuclease VII small subunit [Campylobacter helveticus]MCR2060575.1 exodeoxyribonuclease VII small subunit [Campylobacter helveticus]MCR2062675.1 exodeoxyribonuclease VII small subunit [Campylobacter helveticus]